MKKKKLMSLFLAAVMSTVMLSSCGTEDGSEQTDGGNGKIQLSIDCWPNEDANPKAYANAMRKKEAFEEMYPDIELVPEAWAYDVKSFMARAEGGTLPVLYQASFTEAEKLIKFNYSSDVTEYVKKYGYYGKINESILERVSEDGKIYLLPKSAYTLGIVINLDLFREAGLVTADDKPMIPETFEQLAEYAEIIHQKTGKAGLVFPTAENAGGWNFTMLAWNFGAEFMKNENGKWKSIFASEECAAALEYLKDLKWNKEAMPANTKVNNSEVVKLVGTKQAAMAIVHPAQLTNLIKDYGMDTSSIVMAKMPAGPERHVTLMGGSFYAFAPNATPEQIDAAFKWMQFDNLTTEIDDEAKKRFEEDYKTRYEGNISIIGIQDLSIWSSNAEIEQFKAEMMEKYRNIPIENVENYNNKDNIEYQTEEEVCAQDLYSILDSCIQEVLTNKDSDCMEILKKASSDFQNNFLDYEE